MLTRRFHSSVTEIGLTIFTASLAALRPLLNYFRGKGMHSTTKNPSHERSWGTMNPREMGPPIPLDDVSGESESQKNIFPYSKRIVKHTSFEVKYHGEDV